MVRLCILMITVIYTRGVLPRLCFCYDEFIYIYIYIYIYVERLYCFFSFELSVYHFFFKAFQ